MGFKSIAVAAALVAAVLLVPRSARACGQGGANYGGLATALAIGVAALAVDGAFLLYDGGSAIAGHHPGMAYGITEIVISTPQLILGGAVVGNMQQSGLPAAYIGLMGLMLVHGVWTVATQPPKLEVPSEPGPPDSVARADLRPKFGLGVTMADVGQQSRPGLGVVGRF